MDAGTSAFVQQAIGAPPRPRSGAARPAARGGDGGRVGAGLGGGGGCVPARASAGHRGAGGRRGCGPGAGLRNGGPAGRRAGVSREARAALLRALTMASTGPLAGMTVIEMAAIGPVPHCGMVLRELGADVLRIERSGPSGLGIDLAPGFDALARGKRVVALDPEGDGRARYGAGVRRCGRHPHRGFPARRHGAARPGGRSRAWRATRGWSTGACQGGVTAGRWRARRGMT